MAPKMPKNNVQIGIFTNDKKGKSGTMHFNKS